MRSTQRSKTLLAVAARVVNALGLKARYAAVRAPVAATLAPAFGHPGTGAAAPSRPFRVAQVRTSERRPGLPLSAVAEALVAEPSLASAARAAP